MSDYIPDEILIEILARLPVKSLCRFTSVCKLWYSLITNPNFVTEHLDQTSKRNSEKLLLRFYNNSENKEHYLLFTDDEEFEKEYIELDFPFKSVIGYFRIVGSCNGLICLCDDYFQDTETVIIWNPSIRKSVALPLPDKPQTPYMRVIGFGFDSAYHEYKVVRILYEKENLSQFKVPPLVEVYVQGKGSWRGIDSVPPRHCMVEFVWSQAFLKGAVHWIAYDPSKMDGFRSLIMVFDMGDEIFSEIMLPPVLADQRPTFLSVTLFKESLAVLCCGQLGAGSCCVWEMRDYGVAESWTKLYSINPPGVFTKTLGFRMNGEILLISDTGCLISYDPRTKTISNTRIQGSSYSFKVQCFVESLVLLKA